MDNIFGKAFLYCNILFLKIPEGMKRAQAVVAQNKPIIAVSHPNKGFKRCNSVTLRLSAQCFSDRQTLHFGAFHAQQGPTLIPYWYSFLLGMS